MIPTPRRLKMQERLDAFLNQIESISLCSPSARAHQPPLIPHSHSIATTVLPQWHYLPTGIRPCPSHAGLISQPQHLGRPLMCTLVLSAEEMPLLLIKHSKRQGVSLPPILIPLEEVASNSILSDISNPRYRTI